MYLRPSTLDEAVHALHAHPAQILGGGTDVFPALGDRPALGPILDLSRVADFRSITQSAEGVRIGGGATWADLIAAPLPRGFDGLKAAAREVGSVQIQNTGTLAGNLCTASPAGDGIPPLLALDAEVELACAEGRRVLPLAQFITGYRRTVRRADEIVSAILVPRDLDEAASAFVKLGARRYLVISIVSVAAALQADDRGRVGHARVAVGACSAVPQRLTGLEAALKGASLGDAASQVRPEHLAELSPIDDVRATAAYRRDAARTLVCRALRACADLA